MTRRVLLLGGNGMLGGDLALALKDRGCSVICCNRGSRHFDNRTRVLSKVDRVIHCDRRHLDSNDELKSFLHSLLPSEESDYPGEHDSADRIARPPLDFVVDLSAFHSGWVKRSLATLGPYISQGYILISSDSVYEVCEPSCSEASGRTESEDSRPQCKRRCRELKRRDSYGNSKYKCEGALRRYCRDNNVPWDYSILRLADVLGPRDGTDRFVSCLLLGMHAAIANSPMPLPGPFGRRLSFVFSADVVDIITRLVTGHVHRRQWRNEAFNLACHDPISTEQLCHIILDQISAPPSCRRLTPKSSSSGQSSSTVPTYYPSVEGGPVDCSKAAGRLEWRPLPAHVQLEALTKHYLSELVEQTREAREAFDSFCDDVDGVFAGETPDLSAFITAWRRVTGSAATS